MRTSRFLLLCFALAAGSSAWAATTSKPNIVFLLSDDHSYPFLSCYGDTNVHTPAIDSLAADGMKFHRFFTGAPQCVPSRATFMTGRSPVAARMTRFSSPLPADEVTFPELLRREGGYFTGVFGRGYHLDGPGSDRAKEVADRLEARKMRTFRGRLDMVETNSPQQVPGRLADFFDRKPAGKPFFLWVNFSDPHHPWNASSDQPSPAKLKIPAHWPDTPAMRQQLAAYCGEVNRVDRQVAEILEILKKRGLVENTIVIFTGDNGMAFPHGKGSLYDPGLNVPFILRWPGTTRPGGESRTLLSGEDVGPTLLSAAGVKVPARMSGVSFLPLLRGEAYTPRQYVFGERGPHGSAPVTVNMGSGGYDLSRCVRSDRYKFIYHCTPWIPYQPVDSASGAAWKEMVTNNENGTLAPELRRAYFTTPRPVYELYDLERDPSELNNLSGTAAVAAVERDLREALIDKMIVDFDYLPLPAPLRTAAAGEVKSGPKSGKRGKNK